MNKTRTMAFLQASAAAALLGALAGTPSHAQTQLSELASPPVEQVANGHRYLTGGYSLEEVTALQSMKSEYPLRLVTAARSGAYLAGAQVRIRDRRGATAFDAVADGPLLMVDLPPGRYTVEATVDGRTQRRMLDVPARGAREVVLYFNESVALSPDLLAARRGSSMVASGQRNRQT